MRKDIEINQIKPCIQTALAFVLGICPIFLQRFPSVSGDLPAFLPDVPPASLDRALKSVLVQR